MAARFVENISRSLYIALHTSANLPCELFLGPHPAVFVPPPEPFGRPGPLPGRVPRPLCRVQGTAHFPGEDQERQGGKMPKGCLTSQQILRFRKNTVK